MTVDNIVQFITRSNPASAIVGKLEDSNLDLIIDRVSTILHIDAVDLMVVADLDSSAYEEVADFCSTIPFGQEKLVVLNITGCSAKLQISLSYLIESLIRSSISAHFVIFSDSPLASALSSKCYTYFLGSTPPSDSSKTKALKALAAASLGEYRALEEVAKSWTEEDLRALKDWACERISKRYISFKEAEVTALGFSEEFATSLLEALSVLRFAESRKVVYSVLMASMVK